MNYIDWDLKMFEEIYGKYHVSLNYGDILYGYLTNDAKIITLKTSANSKIIDIGQIDLMKQL